MNPALIPLIGKVGEIILDRVSGSKTAKITSTIGAGTIAGTMAIDPGLMLFPDNSEYALIANSLFYLIGLIGLAFKERKRNKNE